MKNAELIIFEMSFSDAFASKFDELYLRIALSF